MLSIIIPHYKSWVKLNELLDSIPASANIETIVVDDKTEDVDMNFERLRESFPNVLFIKNNTKTKGAGAARNIGLEQASGKWLLFADADDKFDPYLLKSIGKYIDTEYDIIYFKPASFKDVSYEIGTRHLMYEKYVSNYLENKSRENELRLRYEFLVPWSKLIRHSVVKDNNIRFEEIMQSNDILFSAKVGYYASEIEADTQTIYYVRESAESLTSKVTEKSYKVRFNAWVDYVLFLKRHLSHSDFKLLEISSMPMFAKVYENNLNKKNYLRVINTSIKNKIPLVDNRIYNLRKMISLLSDKRK